MQLLLSVVVVLLCSGAVVLVARGWDEPPC